MEAEELGVTPQAQGLDATTLPGQGVLSLHGAASLPGVILMQDSLLLGSRLLREHRPSWSKCLAPFEGLRAWSLGTWQEHENCAEETLVGE